MESPTDKETTVDELKEAVSRFVRERKWKRFHNPKNLAESICIESSELLELFQWLTTNESKTLSMDPEKISRLSEEFADVLIYCLAFANIVHIDIADAVLFKLREGARRYPTSRYRGRKTHHFQKRCRKT